jgi:Putative Zn-dependent protease, contains TPR repeats
MRKPAVSDEPTDFHELPFWKRAWVVFVVEYRDLSLPNKLVLGAIVFGLALAPLAPFAKPFLAEWKQKQAFNTALDAWEKGDFATAGSAFREATKGSTAVERWVEYARFATDAGEENATSIWRRTVALNPQDPDLQTGYANTILETGKPADALAAIAAMPEEVRKDPRVLTLRAEAFLLLGRDEQAATAFRQASAAAGTSDEVTALKLAIIGSKVGDSNERAAARTALERFSESSDRHIRIPALRAIVDSASGEELATAAGKLARSEDASFDDRLTAFKVLLAADAGTAHAILPELQSAAESDPKHSVQLLRLLLETDNEYFATKWLVAREGDPVEVTARLAVETSLHAGDWKALELHLADSGLADPQLARMLLSAQTFRATRPDFALDRWKNALRQVHESGELLDVAARVARGMNWDDAWIVTKRRALELDPTNAEVFDELIAFHKNRRDLPGMFAVINQRLGAEPGNAELRNLALHCRLVLAVGNPQANLAEAQDFARTSPGDPESATTLALALYRADRLEEAAEVFGSMKPEALEDPERAIFYGMTLAALGRGSEAMEILQSASGADATLFPEVIAFRARALEAAAAGNPPQTTADDAFGGNASL